MRKNIIILVMATLLLTSCSQDESQVVLKNLESDNQLLKEQVKSLEGENERLKEQNEELTSEVEKLDERIERRNDKIDDLRYEVKMLEKSQSFIIDDNDVDTRIMKEVDLNNDGNRELIKLESSEDRFFKLSINHTSLSGMVEKIDNSFEVVDLNEDDEIKEIAISELDSNKNFNTKFYRYTANSIFYVGSVPGHIKDIEIYEDGSLTTSSDGKILHSWTFDDKYVLNSDHMLVNEPQESYEMNQKVKVLKSIPLLKAPKEKEMVAALTVGEEVVIISSDNKNWCKVRKENGVEGWFEVVNFDKVKGTDSKACEIFEGLNVKE
ncbi:SH3 domain-containing protein [Wukongibacter baidiensis]|uniref:SH3 domain-containing protein n=1 Tax=Wukongibacter baidiensis TaxID=1723361 RepID=UPI003D7FFD6E